MAWQESIGYGKRSRIEAQIGLWKAVIGPNFKATNFDNQTTEGFFLICGTAQLNTKRHLPTRSDTPNP
jgi:hypothetical protein